MSSADLEDLPYSPDFPGDQNSSYQEGSYFHESTLSEDVNLVDVLKYSEDDLDKLRDEAILEEKEKLSLSEKDYLIEKNELQKWFDSEMRLIKRTTEEHSNEIDNEIRAIQENSVSQSVKFQEEIESTNLNIQSITQEAVFLKQVFISKHTNRHKYCH